MHYRDLGKAASIDSEFSGKSISTGHDGYPASPISVNYDGSYEKALQTKYPKDIARFLKSWRTRTGISLAKLEKHIQSKRQELNTLENLDITSVDLGSSVLVGEQPRLLRDLIIDLFNTFSNISDQLARRDYTGSSKTLHVLLPELFVMWDDCIRCAYGCKVKGWMDAGQKYFKFLGRVQNEAKEAVESYCQEQNCEADEAPRRVREELYEGGFYPFARLLDIYNFQKYTIGDNRLW